MRKLVPLALLLFGCGVVVGWWLRPAPDVAGDASAPAIALPDPGPGALALRPAPRGEEESPATEARNLLAAGRLEAARDLLQAHLAHYRPTLAELLLLAECEQGVADYAAEVETLYQARLLADGPAAAASVAERLARAIDEHSRALVAEHRWGDLDLFYEQLISLEPEQGEHYLQLALLRMRLGRLSEALDPLQRIEHHPELGDRARELLARVARDLAGHPEIAEELAMELRDPHFLVTATLDGTREVRLLIDTGAAVTVLRPEILGRLGYDLSRGDRQYFATANGVISAPIVDLSSLGLGSAVLEDLPVAAMELPGSRGIDGLLGMNYLSRYRFEIDQERRLLRLRSVEPAP